MNRTALLLPILLLASAGGARADHFRVYLLGGQSNGNGRADAAQLEAPLDAPQPDVRFYWHRTQDVANAGHLVEDQSIDLAPGSGHGTGAPVFAKEFGSELSFGRSMADAVPAANIAIIKYTHGGSNLHSDWSAGGMRYASFVSTVQAGLAALTTAGHSYELRGMLWHQGESDTGGANADNYQANLTSLIARVRSDLAGGAPLPFVIGSLSDSQYADITTVGSGPYKVRQAQEAVAAADPDTGIVIADGYSVRSDVIHLDHDGQIALGQDFAAEMLALEAGAADPCGARPNVIFVLGDDQSWYDYSFMYRAGVESAALDANPAVLQVAKTPSIDRLVDEGLTFTHGYTTPLCRPSLAAMVTGTYPHQNWITGNDLAGRPPDQEVEARLQRFHPLPHTLATRLGYTSFQTGKWWEGHHSNGGFTAGDTVNSTAGGSAPTQWGGGRPSYVTARHGDWGLMTGRVDYVNDLAAPAHPIPYANTVQTVTDFINSQVAVDQPFFLWYAPFLPHTPHDPPAGLLAEYTALGLNDTDARYYANVERFDGGVGAILDHLDAVGITENTIVVMICDNGRDQPGPVGKQFPYDSGVRTPIIVRWPDRIRPGGEVEPQIIKTPVNLVDMVPTVHHALGLPIYPEMTGIDLLDLGAVAARETIFGADYLVDIQDLDDPTQSLESRFATRDGWKLIRFTGGSDELYQLYDSSTGAPVDPFETNDIAAAHPAIVSELGAEIQDWYEAPKGQQIDNSEAASFVVAADDLLQTSLDASAPVVTTGDFSDVGGTAVTGEPALRNGVWDNDASGRGDAGTGDGATATYFFDLAASPLGYTVDQIDLYSNWGPGQDRDEIRVSIDYALVASPANFDNHIAINDVYDPPTHSQGKMSITRIGTPGVAAIRFTWPASQEGGAVGYSELDVIGTADGSDSEAPHLFSLSPDNGAAEAPIGGDLEVRFCEPIQAGTGSVRLFESDGTLVETFDAGASQGLTFNGARVTIDPSDDLIGGTVYYVQIDPTAIGDLSGNPFGGISDTSSWRFTADGTPPTVSSLIPADGSTTVLVTSALAITFGETVRPGVGDITIHLLGDGSVVQTIGVTSGSVSLSGARVTIDPPVDLALDTAYYVNIPAGAITDLSGNAWVGIDGSTTWNFTTAATSAIHHWEFEGDATDSVGSHDGTLVGDATFAAGVIGQAASLDGDGDSISIGAASLPATDFTMTAWIHPDSVTGFNYVAGTQQSANAGSFLRVDDGVAFVNLLPPADTKRASGGTVPASAWTHLACTVDSNAGLTVFVDGNPVATDPAGTGHTAFGNFTIGARPDGGTFGFDGLIDDLRIYATVLPQGEIAELAGNGGGVDTTAPEASSLSPADGAGGVAVDSNFTVTFDEAVREGSGDILIKSAGGNTVETIPIGSGAATVNVTQLIINPVTELDPAAGYFINIDAGAIEDLAGNAYPGIGDSTTWNFTTAPAASDIGLIHHWKLDGDGSDSGTPGGHDGTEMGDASYTTGGGGNFGEAVVLDGDGDSLLVNQSSLPATDFTLTAWVFRETAEIQMYVAGTQNSGSTGAFLRAGFDAADDERAFFNLLPPGNAARLAGGTIPLNAWTHLAATVSSTAGLELFVDGSSVGIDPAGTGHTPHSNFRIGARPDVAGTFGFDGLIDDVAIFDGVLGSAQLARVIALGAENFDGPANDFSSWIANPAFGLDPSEQGFFLDPDGDNLANGLEAWFGTHPGEANVGLTGLVSDGTTSTFSHPQNDNPLSDLAGFYEWSVDLSNWYLGDGADGPPGGSTLLVTTDTVGTTTTVSATASSPQERLFLRAGVGQN